MSEIVKGSYLGFKPGNGKSPHNLMIRNAEGMEIAVKIWPDSTPPLIATLKMGMQLAVPIYTKMYDNPKTHQKEKQYLLSKPEYGEIEILGQQPLATPGNDDYGDGDTEVQPAAPAPAPYVDAKEAYWLRKSEEDKRVQKLITRQACLNTAVNIMAQAKAEEDLTGPKALETAIAIARKLEEEVTRQ
jgi:hypothetical protein